MLFKIDWLLIGEIYVGIMLLAFFIVLIIFGIVKGGEDNP